MANMSYCRFQNTADDFADCADNWFEDMSLDELRAKRRMLRSIRGVLESLGIDYDGNDFDEAISDIDSDIERANA